MAKAGDFGLHVGAPGLRLFPIFVELLFLLAELVLEGAELLRPAGLERVLLPFDLRLNRRLIKTGRVREIPLQHPHHVELYYKV